MQKWPRCGEQTQSLPHAAQATHTAPRCITGRGIVDLLAVPWRHGLLMLRQARQGSLGHTGAQSAIGT